MEAKEVYEVMISLLLAWKWWDKPIEEINALIPVLTNRNLMAVKAKIKSFLE